MGKLEHSLRLAPVKTFLLYKMNHNNLEFHFKYTPYKNNRTSLKETSTVLLLLLRNVQCVIDDIFQVTCPTLVTNERRHLKR